MDDKTKTMAMDDKKFFVWVLFIGVLIAGLYLLYEGYDNYSIKNSTEIDIEALNQRIDLLQAEVTQNQKDIRSIQGLLEQQVGINDKLIKTNDVLINLIKQK